MFAETQRSIVELHRGHDCETWRLILDDVGRAAVNRVGYREWQLRHGTKQLVPGGHEFLLDARGRVDNFAMDSDRHNGPKCVACDEMFCELCNPDVYTERCEGRSTRCATPTCGV